ncbi:hypothetical protein E1A91_D12G092600v1 [Gossypium mustelinum]|uniref:Uncharacterized protein n=1 Tax=Gossypium mustelinum TaxID=34275 RepID=A0A5D2SCI9_GOSMU|nr:hypothetical protein E1A91_D12G092600v1 [Gossypium mustelinum]
MRQLRQIRKRKIHLFNHSNESKDTSALQGSQLAGSKIPQPSSGLRKKVSNK